MVVTVDSSGSGSGSGKDSIHDDMMVFSRGNKPNKLAI